MRMTREVAIYLRTVNRMDAGLRSGEASLRGFATRVSRMFRDLAFAISAAFVGITSFALYTGAQFEQALANTSSMFITAAKSAQELDTWMKGLESTARALGANTAYTATEAAEAMYALASGGLNAKEVMEATEQVLYLAGATMSDMTSAAELMMASLRQFQIDAFDAARVTNVFAAAIQNSMLTMERLHYSMQYAGPVAARLSLSIEETTAALALLHNAGLKGSLAGVGMRQIMIRLIRPNEELTRALKGTTVSVDGFAAVLERLKEAGLRPDQAARMFGQRTLAALSVMLAAGKEGMEEMVAKITDTDAAAAAYAIQMDTVRSQMIILKSIAQELGLTIFDVFKPDLRRLIDLAQRALKGLTPRVKEFYEYIRELAVRYLPIFWEALVNTVSFLIGFGKGVFNAARTFISLAKATWEVIKAIGEFLLVGAAIFAVLLPVIGLLTNFSGVILVITKVWNLFVVAFMKGLMRMWLAVMSNPVTAVVALIAGALAALVIYWKKQAGSWEGVWEQLKYAVRIAGSHTIDALIGFAREFMFRFRGFTDTLWAGIKVIGTIIKEGFLGFLRFVKDVAVDFLDPRKTVDWNSVKTRWAENMGDLGDKVKASWASSMEDVSETLDWSKGLFSGYDGEAARADAKRAYDAAMAAIKERAENGEQTPFDNFVLANPGAFAMPEPDFDINDSVMKFGNPFQAELGYIETYWETGLNHMEDVYYDSWDTIWDTTRTGSEKWLDIWKDTFSTLGDMFLDFFKRQVWQLMPDWSEDDDFATTVKAIIGRRDAAQKNLQQASLDAAANNGMLFGEKWSQREGIWKRAEWEKEVNDSIMTNFVETQEVQQQVFLANMEGRKDIYEDYINRLGQEELNRAAQEETLSQARLARDNKEMVSDATKTSNEVANSGARMSATEVEANVRRKNYVEKEVQKDTNIATNYVEMQSEQQSAIAKFFNAHAWLPFVGAAIAAGLIALMMGYFHDGGLIGGSGARAGDTTEQLFMGQKGEFVMPAAATREYLPYLEAMRAGTFNFSSLGAGDVGPSSAFSAAGAGGGSTTVQVAVNVPSGSLLMANDKQAVRRFAEQIHDEIEYKIKPSIGD